MREKLSTEQVSEIRNRWAKGGVTQAQLAADYGIHSGHVSRLVNNQSRGINTPSRAEVFLRIKNALR